MAQLLSVWMEQSLLQRMRIRTRFSYNPCSANICFSTYMPLTKASHMCMSDFWKRANYESLAKGANKYAR